MIGFIQYLKRQSRKLIIFSGFTLFSFQFFYSHAESINELKVKTNNSEIKSRISYQSKYLLGPGDKVEITFLDAKDFSGIYEIFNDGAIYLPLIGAVKIKNLSTEKATEKIQKLYENELLRPNIFIKLIQARPIKVSVIGEIERPGIYSFKSIPNNANKSTSEIPTVIDALKLAGGVTSSANLKEVLLLRKFEGENLEIMQTSLNLLDLLIEGDLSQNLYLFDGDVIKLVKAKEMSPNLVEIAESNFSPYQIKVTVIGAVENPGLLELKSGSTLMQAIMQAGGPITWDANKRNVQLIRLNKNGSTFLKRYKIDISKRISKKDNPLLKNGDIVKVNKTNFAKLSDGIEKTTKPLSGIVNVYTLFKILE